MPDCELSIDCPFFHNRMAEMPALTDMYKTIYCHEDSGACARYQVYRQLGRGRVPPDLFPHMQEEAQAMLGPR